MNAENGQGPDARNRDDGPCTKASRALVISCIIIDNEA